MRGVRQWRSVGLLFALLGASLWAAPLPVAAATDQVTICANSGPGSLPYIVANVAQSGDTIVFAQDCAGADEIVLTGTIVLAQDVTIDANGHAVTVDGGCTDSCGTTSAVGGTRVFSVNSAVTATLTGLTIQDGNTSGPPGGGGINNNGTLSLMNSTISGNSAGDGSPGGGIANGGTLSVTDSTISGNTTDGRDGGSGIDNFNGALTITNSTISDNSTTGGGPGAIASYGGTLTITNSIVSGNSSENDAGGIYSSSPLTVTNSTISDNRGGTRGGGLLNAATGAVTNSTITGNSGGDGGGIYTYGTLSLTNSTITGNSSGMDGGGIFDSGGGTTITNTILAGNTAATSGPDVSATLTSGGRNLVGKTDGSSGWIASDLTGTVATPLTPLLGSLADNGGPTQTIAPLSGSPASGAGDASVCRQSGTGMVNGMDQRGQPRLASSCDIGAVQTQGTQVVAGLSGGAAGTSRSFAVALFDGFGTTLAAYTGTVHFINTDALATPLPDYTFTGRGVGKDNGFHSFTVTFRTAGTQTVTVTDTLSGTLTTQVTAVVTPVVSSVGPPSGGTAGGNRVTLAGLGFGTDATNVAVTIGGNLAPVASVTNTQLVVTAPAHGAGGANVVVTVNGQGTTLPNGYTYGAVNLLPGAQPAGGAGGSPGALPTARPSGDAQGGSPSPLPAPRP